MKAFLLLLLFHNCFVNRWSTFFFVSSTARAVRILLRARCWPASWTELPEGTAWTSINPLLPPPPPLPRPRLPVMGPSLASHHRHRGHPMRPVSHSFAAKEVLRPAPPKPSPAPADTSAAPAKPQVRFRDHCDHFVVAIEPRLLR